MQDFNTDDEYYLAIKRFWKKYGSYITGCLAMFLCVFYGMKLWNYRVQRQEENASGIYFRFNNDFQQILQIEEDNKKADKFLMEEVKNITHNYPNTMYASFAQLAMAKLDVNQNNLLDAENSLQSALANTKDEDLQVIIKLRLIRVYLAENKLQEANKVFVSLPKDVLNESLALELKGDLFKKENKYKAAQESYNKAIVSANNAEQQAYIKMKMSNLK